MSKSKQIKDYEKIWNDFKKELTLIQEQQSELINEIGDILAERYFVVQNDIREIFGVTKLKDQKKRPKAKMGWAGWLMGLSENYDHLDIYEESERYNDIIINFFDDTFTNNNFRSVVCRKYDKYREKTGAFKYNGAFTDIIYRELDKLDIFILDYNLLKNYDREVIKEKARQIKTNIEQRIQECAKKKKKEVNVTKMADQLKRNPSLRKALFKELAK